MHQYSTVKAIDGLISDSEMVRLVDSIITTCSTNGYCTLQDMAWEAGLEKDQSLILISLIARGHIHNVEGKYYPLGDVYQAADGMYFTLEKPINKEEIMTDSHPRCIACDEKVTSTGVTKMCKWCVTGIIGVLERLERETNESGDAYTEAFANLNEEDGHRRDAVMAAYKSISQLMHYRQRHEAMDAFKQKVVRTVSKGDDFGKAIDLWWKHMLIHARYDLVKFHSISIKSPDVAKWMNDNAKRKNR